MLSSDLIVYLLILFNISSLIKNNHNSNLNTQSILILVDINPT